MPDQHTLLHLVNLKELARDELIRCNLELYLAELNFTENPTPTHAHALIQAQGQYAIALQNKQAIEGE